MTQWEYQAVTWSFWGPLYDAWPGGDEYERRVQAERDALGRGMISLRDSLEEDPDGLNGQYLSWQSDAENRYLNEVGEAGFELVTLHVDIQRSPPRWPTRTMRAYFKRPRTPDSPEMPRPIGFRPAAAAE